MRSVVGILVLFTSFSSGGAMSGAMAFRGDEARVEFAYFGFDSKLKEDEFKLVFGFKQCHIICRVNYFNRYIDPELRILSIWIDNIGQSAADVMIPAVFHMGTDWFRGDWGISPSSIFPDLFVAHEMGHLVFHSLSSSEKAEFKKIFKEISPGVFVEGNTFPGYPLGHPKDSEGELFASSFAVYYVVGRERLDELNRRVGEFFRLRVDPLGARDGAEEMCDMWENVITP